MKKPSKKNCLLIIIFLVIAIIVWVLLYFVFKDNGKQKNTYIKKPEQFTNIDKNNENNFYIGAVEMNSKETSIYDKPNSYDKASLGVIYNLDFIIETDKTVNYYLGDKVDSMRLTNFKILEKPVEGEACFLSSSIKLPNNNYDIKERQLGKQFDIPVIKEKYTNEEKWTNYYSNEGQGHINFIYAVTGITSKKPVDKSKISFDIIIKTKTKAEFLKHMEIEISSENPTINLNQREKGFIRTK